MRTESGVSSPVCLDLAYSYWPSPISSYQSHRSPSKISERCISYTDMVEVPVPGDLCATRYLPEFSFTVNPYLYLGDIIQLSSLGSIG